MTGAQLDVSGLTVEYRIGHRSPALRAVDHATFALAEGETMGLVGESGSGKTTLARAILGLIPASSGSVKLNGKEITNLTGAKRRALSSTLQAVFQDPYSSLNPARTVGKTLSEGARAQGLSKSEAQARAIDVLEQVGLPGDAIHRYPARFSGGQRQRIAIARALVPNPKLIVCDEPTSALDLSVQAQILNLLQDLQEQLGVSYLFISHDLAVVRHISHQIVVLYRGQIMEQGDARSISERPGHPYTQTLLAAAPIPDPIAQRLRRNAGVYRPAHTWESTGCPFAPRCSLATQLCIQQRPPKVTTPTGTQVACHHWREAGGNGAAAGGKAVRHQTAV